MFSETTGRTGIETLGMNFAYDGPQSEFKIMVL